MPEVLRAVAIMAGLGLPLFGVLWISPPWLEWFAAKFLARRDAIRYQDGRFQQYLHDFDRQQADQRSNQPRSYSKAAAVVALDGK